MTTEHLHRLFLKHPRICTDTRKIISDAIFFALKGDNFDGNTFALQAINEGAAFAIIDNVDCHLENGKTIVVENSLKALQELATFHRNYLGIPILALTGSNGKTTTKELINAVLQQKYKTEATSGNLNNHIGVPLTLLAMDTRTEIGIVEMGANHAMEIDFLCKIANPDYGYITNFGKAHLEGFGNLEGVIEAKTELYRSLNVNKKNVFVNSNDPIQLEKTKGMKTFSFGTKNTESDVQYELIDANPYIRIKFSDMVISSNLIGIYNAPNIATAIAIGTYFKVSKDAIKKGIENYIPTNNRSQIINKDSNTIILDAYNANPSSMLAAVENFKQLKAINKILFLGDMFELGSEAEMEHQNIVNLVSNAAFSKVFYIGKNFFKTNILTNNAVQFETFEEAKAHLANQKITNSSILIKGSRGMALERLLDIL